MISGSVVDYILDFLVGAVALGDTQEAEDTASWALPLRGRNRRIKLIRYTRDPEKMRGADVVIYPSNFFDLDIYGTAKAYPSLPLSEWEGVPLLFGSPRWEWSSDGCTLIVYADLVASTYFLISRYEEMWRRDERDERGCFPGKASLAYKAGFLHRPIVDEYGAVLRNLLERNGILDRVGAELSPREQTFAKVNMTYDVEHLFRYAGIGGLRRALSDGLSLSASWTYLLGRHQGDPYYETLQRIIRERAEDEQARLRPRIETTLFWGIGRSRDALTRIRYRLPSRVLRILLAKGERAGISHGLLFGIEASHDPRRLSGEKEATQHKLGRVVIHSRHQGLALREPEDMLDLLSIGVRHDYSMGYADVPGYRLGTCRAVRFINPNTRALTEMVMHPILSLGAGCQGSDEQEAYEQLWASAVELIKATARHSGELNLRWSISSLSSRLSPSYARLHEDTLRLLHSLLSQGLPLSEPDDAEDALGETTTNDQDEYR